MKTLIYALLLAFTLTQISNSQTGRITGKIVDALLKKPLTLVTVVISEEATGTLTDSEGVYNLSGLQYGFYSITYSSIGYTAKTIFEVGISSSTPTILDIELYPATYELKEIALNPSLFSKAEETPLSSRSLGLAEIERAPGGGRDVSRVIEVLPGVATPPASNRNDLIIRGGSPAENRFFIDGFEVGAINHFTTQGSSGGVWGVIDASLIKQLDLITSSFPVSAGNVLSSVFDLKLKDGNREQTNGQICLGVIQTGANISGPVTENMNYIGSLRTANFNWLIPRKNPIIPTFYDGMVKTSITLDTKNNIQILALGSYDEMGINKNAAVTEENLFALERVRSIDQYIYTAGIKYQHFWGNGFTTFYISRNELSNTIKKFQDNDAEKLKLLHYTSNEAENKMRVENKLFFHDIILGFGAGFDHANYTVTNNYFRVNQNGTQFISFDSQLKVNKFSLFGNICRHFMKEAVAINVGLRLDANDYSYHFSNPLRQASPRISISYQLLPNITLLAGYGLYFQNPSYASMGYIVNNTLANKDELSPLKATHFTMGIEYITKVNSMFSLEGFYKYYQNYPNSVTDMVSLANKGAGFGVYGAEMLTSSSKGRSYGIELLYQQKLYNGFYGILSYTFVKSEFIDKNQKYLPSAWDFGSILNATIGKQFSSYWEIGFKLLYNGGAPYTPYDKEVSSKKENWDKHGSGILDYTKLNTERTDDFFEIDIRIDKKYYFEKWNLDLFVDVRNILDYQKGTIPDLILERDANMNPLTKPQDQTSYSTKISSSSSTGRLIEAGALIAF